MSGIVEGFGALLGGTPKPKPPKPVGEPPSSGDDAVQRAAEEERRRRAIAGGRASTIRTSAAGDLAPAPIARKRLFGE